MSRTLVIAAHMDDEVLASAGLIQHRLAQGGEVKVLVVFGRKYGGSQAPAAMAQEKHDFQQAQEVLGYERYQILGWEEGVPYRGSDPSKLPSETASMTYQLMRLEEIVEQYRPTEVVIPGRGDLNQDHRFLNELCRIVLRPANLGYVTRILEALAHDTLDGPQSANYAVGMTDGMVEKARRAMGCYERESRPSPHPRCPSNIEARWRIYGAQFGYKFAEAYRLVLEKE